MEELNNILQEFNQTLVEKIINGKFNFIKHYQNNKKHYYHIEVDGFDFTIEIYQNKDGGTDFYIQDMDSEDLHLLEEPFSYNHKEWERMIEILNTKRK